MTRSTGSNQYRPRSTPTFAVDSVPGAIMLKPTVKATIAEAADWWEQPVSHDSDTSVAEFLSRVHHLIRQQEVPGMRITLVHPDGMRVEAEVVRAHRSRFLGRTRHRLSVTYLKDGKPERSWASFPPRALLRQIVTIAANNYLPGMTMTVMVGVGHC